MPNLKDKLEKALNEARILVLMAEVLLAFQLQSIFQTGFDRLPEASQEAKLVSLGLMLVSVILLMSPAAFHRIAEGGQETERMLRFITAVVALALVPFAVSFALDAGTAMVAVRLPALSRPVAIVTLLIALSFWYGFGIWHRRTHMHEGPSSEPEQDRPAADDRASHGTPLKDRVSDVLTELRVVLPGIQAVVAFQFAIVLTEPFEKLPRYLQYTHLGSTALVALSTIVLMTPAAFHRIAEHGEDTEHFHTFASRMLLWAMGLLAVGMSVDFYVICARVLNENALSLALAGAMLAFFLGLWFGYTTLVKKSRRAAARQPSLDVTA